MPGAPGDPVQLDPFQLIRNVGWRREFYALIEFYKFVGNVVPANLVSHSGLDCLTPFAGFLEDQRFDPRPTSLPSPVPHAFPPSQGMKRSYRFWGEDLAIAQRDDIDIENGDRADQTVHAWVANLARVSGSDDVVVRITTAGSIGSFVTRITVRLFRHADWMKTTIVGEDFGVDLIEPVDGPYIFQQPGKDPPIFSTLINRNNNLSSSQMIEQYPAQPFFDITINRRELFATITPFA